MTITGVHSLLYTSEPDALRAVLRDVFGWDYVEAHPGWLIFRLPPAELGIHPVDEGGAPRHEISFMCDDINATLADLRGHGLTVQGEPRDMSFGVGAVVLLPGDVPVLVYEPRHATAI